MSEDVNKKKPQLKIGDKVVLIVDREAYYSGYNGNPKVIISAGTIGTVGAVDVPQVVSKRGSGRSEDETFTCVDFVVPDVFQGDPKHNNNIWRCSVYADQMRPMGAATATPPVLSEWYKRNFATLQRANKRGHVALVSAIRKSDQQPVALVCAMQRNDDGSITPVPLAELINGNPFELYEDPTT